MDHDIPNIEDAQFYLDLAFSKAKETAQRKRNNLRERQLEKSRQVEYVKIQTASDVLASRLSNITAGFPSFDQLDEFYTDLCQLHFDIDNVRKALGHVQDAAQRVEHIARDCMARVEDADDIAGMNAARDEFYGRTSSIVQDVDDSLSTLLDAKKAIIDFPVLQDVPTVCITGFPNVGKTTLLKELTGSAPPIESYAFTTKRLNLGYADVDGNRIQFVDTPGTLARPEKMNDIEKQSFVALRHSDFMVYVWDATEQYTIALQQRLYDRVHDYDVPVVEYVSKTDIADVSDVLAEQEACTSVDELWSVIRQRLP